MEVLLSHIISREAYWLERNTIQFPFLFIQAGNASHEYITPLVQNKFAIDWSPALIKPEFLLWVRYVERMKGVHCICHNWKRMKNINNWNEWTDYPSSSTTAHVILISIERQIRNTMSLLTLDPFLESPETLKAYFRWHNSLCISKTKASWGTKLYRYLQSFCCLARHHAVIGGAIV